jgi:anti-sigma regulatory factor (Ser/Thr protein kinase)
VDSPATRRFSARQAEFDSIAAFIESACADLKDDERLRIVLLVEELFANSVNHGYGGDSDQPVWLTLGVGKRDCHLVYEDCAPPYNPFESGDASNMPADLADRPVGGLGVVLLMELSSSRSYERRGDRNVIELHVPCSARH